MKRAAIALCAVLAPAIAYASPHVDASALEDLRTAGAEDFSSTTGDTLTIDVCVTKKGKVSKVKILAGTSDASFDASFVADVKKHWRFKPYKKRKKAIAVCATFTFGGDHGGPPDGTFPDGIGDPPPPPPPPPPKVETVTPQTLEVYRLSGDINIAPDADTKDAIKAAGKKRLVVPVKLCVDDTGHVKSAILLKSSGFTDYDTKIETTMKTWTYKPFEVDGKAVPVCTAVTFIYVQK